MSHLDEGTLHALIDGEIPSEELGPIEAHLAACPECRARLDEARGFARTADRLVALVDLPAEREAPAEVPPPAPAARRAWRPRVSPSTLGWAAGLMLVAGGTWLVTTDARRATSDLASNARVEADTPSAIAGAPAQEPAPVAAPASPAPPPAAAKAAAPERQLAKTEESRRADARAPQDEAEQAGNVARPQIQLRGYSAAPDAAREKATTDTGAVDWAAKARVFKPEVPGPRPMAKRNEVVADAAAPALSEVVTTGQASATDVSLDSAAAARRAGTRLRAIAGLVPARYERVADDADAVRTVYVLDAGHEIVLEQRRGARVDPLGAQRSSGAVAAPPDANLRMLEWYDGSLVLRLSGRVAEETLASLRGRVR